MKFKKKKPKKYVKAANRAPNADGSINRPPGAAPGGATWDSKKGEWKNDGKPAAAKPAAKKAAPSKTGDCPSCVKGAGKQAEAGSGRKEIKASLAKAGLESSHVKAVMAALKEMLGEEEDEQAVEAAPAPADVEAEAAPAEPEPEPEPEPDSQPEAAAEEEAQISAASVDMIMRGTLRRLLGKEQDAQQLAQLQEQGIENLAGVLKDFRKALQAAAQADDPEDGTVYSCC